MTDIFSFPNQHDLTRSEWLELLKIDIQGNEGLSFVTITPNTAEFIRSHHTFENQRSINNSRVAVLANAMKKSSFEKTSVVHLVLDKADPVTGKIRGRLVNGNHTLEAICQTKKPCKVTLMVDFESDITVAKRYYSTHDVNKPRNQSALDKGNGIQKNTMNKTVVKILDAGSSWAMAKLRPNDYTMAANASAEKSQWKIDVEPHMVVLESYMARIKKNDPEFFRSMRRGQFPALVASVLHHGTVAQRNKMNSMLEDFASASEKSCIKKELTSGSALWWMAEAISHLGSGTIGRGERMYGLIRAWQMYFLNGPAPINTSDLYSSIEISYPKL